MDTQQLCGANAVLVDLFDCQCAKLRILATKYSRLGKTYNLDVDTPSAKNIRRGRGQNIPAVTAALKDLCKLAIEWGQGENYPVDFRADALEVAGTITSNVLYLQYLPQE